MDHEILHIQWEGPLTFSTIDSYSRISDYGVYQVCGPHPVYGSNALLYIGRAQKRSFAVRLREEGWQGWQQKNGTIQIFLGRLADSITPAPETWDMQIARVEQLLIYAHRPAHNASGLYRNTDPAAGALHVLNWGDRGQLLPEVSGARWSGVNALQICQSMRHMGYMERYLQLNKTNKLLSTVKPLNSQQR